MTTRTSYPATDTESAKRSPDTGSPRPVPRGAVRHSALWLLSVGLLLLLAVAVAGCKPKPKPVPPDDGAFDPVIAGSEIFLGSGLTVPTDNAYGRTLARLAAAQVKSSDAFLALVPEAGGSGDPGDPGSAATPAGGDPLGSSLTVFDRCANGDCSLRSSLVLDNPDVLVDPGVSTTYSGSGSLTVAGDGGIVRAATTTAVQGTVVVDAGSGSATISFSTPVWQDAAGVAGVRLDDVVVSGVLAGGPGGSGDVLVDGTGVVTGVNAWGLADGVAARVSATIGSARPVVAVGGFDVSDGGSIERLIGSAWTAPEEVRRWLRAPEFWVISAPDGGVSRLGTQSPGTEVRLAYSAARPELTLSSQSWTFGQDSFEAVFGIPGSSVSGGAFTGTAWLNLAVGPTGMTWNASGPVRMNLSGRQTAVAGDLVAFVYWSEANACTPCSDVSTGMPSLWVGPLKVAGVNSFVTVEDGLGSYEIEAVGGVTGGYFGPIAATSGALQGWVDPDGNRLDVEAGGKIAGHIATATSEIDLASPAATVSTDITVDDQMNLTGDLDVDLALTAWAATYPATFTMDASPFQVDATAQLARTGFDVQIPIDEPLPVVIDGITLLTSDVQAVGNAVSIGGDAEWTGTGVTAPLAGTLDGTPDGIMYDLDGDAVFSWANGQVELRDLNPRGVLGGDPSMDVSGTFEFPGNVLPFDGTAVASPEGWQFEVYEVEGAPSEFALSLTWDTATGELSGTGTSDSLVFGRVEVTDSPFTLLADTDSVEVTPGSGGRVLVDGGETLDAAAVGAVTFDEATGMLTAEVAGQGTVLGQDGLDVTGSVEAYIVDNEAVWVDLDLGTTGEVLVGNRADVRLDTVGVAGRLEGEVSTLAMDAGVNLLGVALPPVSGDVTVGVTPSYELESVGLDLAVPGAPGQGLLDLDFAGGLASLAVSGSVDVDVLDYGDLSIEGLRVTIGFVPPSIVTVTATFDRLLYRDQVDLAGSMAVRFDLLAPSRLVMEAQASGQIGELQVTDLAVDMVWNIPAQTLTGTAGVGSVEYDFGRVKVVGGGLSFFGDPNGFTASSSSASRVLVDDGETLDAEVSGSVSWDEPSGMLQVTVTGQGTVLGKAQLSVSGTVEAHVVNGQAEWIDLDVSATGEFPVGGRNEIRLASFDLTGRIQGNAALLSMAAELSVLGVEVSVSGEVEIYFTPGTYTIEELWLELSTPLGAGIEVGLGITFFGNLTTFDLNGWLTADRLAWGDFVIEDLRLDLWFNGQSVRLDASADHVRYQNTVDVGGEISLGWELGSETLSISGNLAGRIGAVRLNSVQFEATLTVSTRHLWLNAKATGRAVFGQGRQSVWFEDFHVWGDLDLDENFRATADLNVDGRVGFASEGLGAPIEVSMTGTLAASFDGANLDLTLSVALSGTISATNVTLGISADITQTPIRPVVTLHTEDLAFTLETFEFTGIDLDLLFRYDAGNPELRLTLSDGHVAVHRPDWSVVLNADFASLYLRYSDDTHLRADFAALLNATLTVSGMEDLPVTFAFAGSGYITVDTDTWAATFDLTADTGVSVPLGGDAGVRFTGLHITGSFDDEGLAMDFDATQVAIGPAAEPWVLADGPSGTLTSDAAGHRWNLDLDVGIVTAGDLLLAGQVTGSLQIGTTTTGGLTFTGQTMLGGVIRTLSISAAGMWTGSSLTVAGSIRTGGHDFFGQATWARLGGGQHQLTSVARWETADESVGLDMNIIHDGADGLYGMMTAYGVAVWPGTVASGTVTATFTGTAATATVAIDVGPVTGLRMAATLDWDVDTLTVAEGTFTIEAATSVFGRTVDAAVTVGGSITVSDDSMSVNLTADGHVGLLTDDLVLYFDGLSLAFDVADGTLENATFGGTLFLGPSNWIDVGGTFQRTLPGIWELGITTSTGNGTTGSLGGAVVVGTSGSAAGVLTADGVTFGPGTLDNLELLVTTSSLRIRSLDLSLAQTATTPPLSLAVRNVNITWGSGLLSLSGSLSFGLGGPDWLPVACQAEMTARAELRRVGTSTFTTRGDAFAGCVFGEYGSGFAGIRVELRDLTGSYTTDGSGTVTSAAVRFSGDLLFGDLLDVTPARFSGNVTYDNGSQTIGLSLAGNYGTYTINGTLSLVNGGSLGAYDFTLQGSTGALTIGPVLRFGSVRVGTPIRLVGSGSQFSVTAPSITFEGNEGSDSSTSVTATDVTLTKQGNKLVLTGMTGGVTQTLAEFGALVVTSPTVRNLTAEIEPDAITFGIDADFTASISSLQGAPASLAFSSDLDVVVNSNSANITIGADIQASVDWQPVGGAPAISGTARIAGTINIDLDTLIVTVTGGSLELSPTVDLQLPSGPLDGLRDTTVNGITGTIDLDTGRITFSGDLVALAHLNIDTNGDGDFDDALDLDCWCYVEGEATLTENYTQIDNGTIEAESWGAWILKGLPDPDGPELTDVWLVWRYGEEEALFCGHVFGTQAVTGTGCDSAGTVTGAVEADLDLDGQGDGWPTDPNQRPAGVKVSLASNPAFSQLVNPTDGTFRLVGVPAGTQTIQVTAPPTWSVTGSPTRQVTVTSNAGVAVTPPFVVQPYDRTGGAPYFVGADQGFLVLGDVPENVDWKPRQETQFPIQVIDPDGDPVEVTLGAIYPKSFMQACGGGPACLELNSSGVLEVNPPINWDGLIGVKITASDGHWEDVSVLALITVKPGDCGTVVAPPYREYTTDEDTPLQGSFELGDPCNSDYPAARVVTPPQHGMAGAGIKFIPGLPGFPAIPTHEIEFGYLPAADWSGEDSFVIESCNKAYAEIQGPKYSCALTTVYVTVNPVDDPPRLAARFTQPNGEVLYLPIEYQVSQGKVSLRSHPDTEYTYQLWAYDPEGIYSVESGSITIDEPNATSDRNPADLGLTRTDWDITVTPPEDWDGVGDFAIHLCDPDQCADKTAYLRPPPPEDPDWTASNMGYWIMSPGEDVRIDLWQITRAIPSLPDMGWEEPGTADLQITSPPGVGIDSVTADPGGLTIDTTDGFCNEDQVYMPTVGMTFDGIPIQLRLEVECDTDTYWGSTYLAPGQTKTHAWVKALNNVYARPDPSATTDEQVLVDNLVLHPQTVWSRIYVCSGPPGEYGATSFDADQKVTMAPGACVDDYHLTDSVAPLQWPPDNPYCPLGQLARCDFLGSVRFVEEDVNNDPEVGVEYMSVEVSPGSPLRLTGKQLARDVFGAIDPEDVFDLEVELVGSLSGPGTVVPLAGSGGLEFTASWTPGVSVQQLRFRDKGGETSKTVNLIVVTSPD